MNHYNFSPTALKHHFQTVHDEHQLEYPDFLSFLEQHLFFITTMFHPVTVSVTSSGSHPLNEFGKLYFNIAKELLGNNLDRKRLHQPFTYAFVDFEGTRSCKSSVDILKSELHVHAVTLVRPQHLRRFKSIQQMIPAFEPNSIVNTKIISFTQAQPSLDHLISYCMKGPQKVPTNFHGREDLWAFFPK
jgi:hypothetical protein